MITSTPTFLWFNASHYSRLCYKVTRKYKDFIVTTACGITVQRITTDVTADINSIPLKGKYKKLEEPYHCECLLTLAKKQKSLNKTLEKNDIKKTI